MAATATYAEGPMKYQHGFVNTLRPRQMTAISRRYFQAHCLEWKCVNVLILLRISLKFGPTVLTHWGRVTYICVGKLIIIGSDYLNQCWIIVNLTLANIFQWKSNQSTTIFIDENARENVVCEMASILSWPQCVNPHFARKLPGVLELEQLCYRAQLYISFHS